MHAPLRFVLLVPLLWSFACKDDDQDSADTQGDSGPVVEDYPCDAPYMPFDFRSRRYARTDYKGRFDQLTGQSEVVLDQLGEVEVSEDADVDWGDDMVVCGQTRLTPFINGTGINLFGVDDEWLYLLGDGDSGPTGDVHYWLEEGIPLHPLEPSDTYQDIFSSAYTWQWDDPGELQAAIWLSALVESITVPAGTFDALKMTWEFDGLDSQKRFFTQLDVTTYLDLEEGVVRQSWYDPEDDTSVLIELMAD